MGVVVWTHHIRLVPTTALLSRSEKRQTAGCAVASQRRPPLSSIKQTSTDRLRPQGRPLILPGISTPSIHSRVFASIRGSIPGPIADFPTLSGPRARLDLSADCTLRFAKNRQPGKDKRAVPVYTGGIVSPIPRASGRRSMRAAPFPIQPKERSHAGSSRAFLSRFRFCFVTRSPCSSAWRFAA